MKNINDIDVEDWNFLYYCIGEEMPDAFMDDSFQYLDTVMGNHVACDDKDFHVIDIRRTPKKYLHYFEDGLKVFNQKLGTNYSWYTED